MIRFVIAGLLVVVAWYAVKALIGVLKGRKIDWTGIAFMIGFVALAFHLRHATGMG